MKLSENVTNYLIRLNELLSNFSFENNLALSNKELYILFSATQTGKYSCKYWKTSLLEWRNLNNNETALLMQSDGELAGNIVKGDVAGAVGGAVTAAVVNFVPGAGQVAYGSAILRGAIGASTAIAVEAFLDWIWD